MSISAFALVPRHRHLLLTVLALGVCYEPIRLWSMRLREEMRKLFIGGVRLKNFLGEER